MQIILLKEVTDTSPGRGQMLSNISASTAVADMVRTTLGHHGDDDDERTTISNDGATIMRLLHIVHPAAAKIAVDVAKSQNSEQPQIILYKGTDTSQGRGQMLSNISACTAVADMVRTTLGHHGDDDERTAISNDGATIMRLLDIVHPTAAKIAVDVAKSQDSEVQ